MHANRLCNDLGLDTISTGVTIAFAMECHQRGLLDDPDLSLKWGDADTLLGLIERTAHRHGLGDLLAEGVRRAAEIIGVADRVGSLEVGKDADVVIFSGHPFHFRTVAEVVIINGKVVYRREEIQ